MVYRYFYDCEFIEDGRIIDLVSIGVVDEQGREFYAISTEFDPRLAGSWVRRNVLDRLPSPGHTAWRSRGRIRDELYEFLTEPLRTDTDTDTDTDTAAAANADANADTDAGPGPRTQPARRPGAGTRSAGAPDLELELWAWYGAYDHVVLAQLWGRMPALPREIPRFTKDLRQLWDDKGRPPLPESADLRHDALVDARHNLARWQAMHTPDRLAA